MEFIADSIFPNIDKEIVAKMVEFSNRVGFLGSCRSVTLCWRILMC